MRVIITIMIAIVIWCQGVKPLIANYYYGAALRGDKTAMHKAISYDQDNTLLIDATGDVITAIAKNNGDITAYGAWYKMAILQIKAGNLTGALAALNMSLWYYPQYQLSLDLQARINEKIRATK